MPKTTKTKIPGIYQIKNIINGLIYIGSAKNIELRLWQHKMKLKSNKHINPVLQHSWNKYGEDNFIFETLEELHNADQTKLFEREEYYFEKLRPFVYENGFNIGKTASGGDNLTNNPNREDIIRRIKETLSLKYKDMSEDEIRNILGDRRGEKNANYNVRWDDTQKQNLSKKLKEFYKNNIAYRTGKTFTEIFGKEKADALRKNISDHAKKRVGDKNPFYNRKHTQESKDKMRANNKGHIPSNRKIVEIDGIRYNGLYNAEKETGIKLANIQHRVKSNNPKFNNYKYIEN